MTLPLYRGAADSIPADRRAGHAGLRFQRLFDAYDGNWAVGAEAKKTWLSRYAGPVGDTEALTRYALAQAQLAKALEGVSACFHTSGRFVTGTGYPHPVENGLAWHPVLGVPYLAASSVKGLVRAWVEGWLYGAGEDAARRDRLLAWFGSDHKDPRERLAAAGTGDIIFFDAIPTAPVTLKVDIMTPHLGKWYERGGEIQDPNRQPERVPADWHDPTPIPFLVAERVELLFSMAPRNVQTGARTDLAEVMDCLRDALEWLGAGAKTAIGYGHLERHVAGDTALAEGAQAAARAIAEADMSDGERRLQPLRTMLDHDRSARRVDPGGPLMQQMTALLKEAVTWLPAERQLVAGLAEAAYQHHGWGKAEKKQQRKQVIADLRAGQ